MFFCNLNQRLSYLVRCGDPDAIESHGIANAAVRAITAGKRGTDYGIDIRREVPDH
jgi:hypothetical protein